MKNKAYKIVMSRGDDIQIDADEINNVLKAITSGQPAIVRKGIFNPSFYVSVIEDEERASWHREVRKLKSIFNDDILKLN